MLRVELLDPRSWNVTTIPDIQDNSEGASIRSLYRQMRNSQIEYDATDVKNLPDICTL
jgi:hypothetical protein